MNEALRTGKRQELNCNPVWKSIAKQHCLLPSYEAAVYMGLGDYNRAMELYRKSYAEGRWAIIWSRIGLYMKPLHGTPRFEALRLC